MKRSISFVVALVLMLTLSITAFAADITITGSRINCKPGQVVQVDVKISENSALAAANIDLNFDESVLEYNKYSAGEALEAQTMALGNLADEGFFKFALVDMGGLKKGGIVFSAFFTVKESASGETEIRITTPSLAYADGTTPSADVSNAVIAVSGSPEAQKTDSTTVDVVTESGVQTIDKSSLSKNDDNSYTEQTVSQQEEAVEKLESKEEKEGDQAGIIGDKDSSNSSGYGNSGKSSIKWVIIIAAGVVAAAAVAVIIIMLVAKRKQLNETEEKIDGKDAILSEKQLENVKMQEEIQKDIPNDDEQ